MLRRNLRPQASPLALRSTIGIAAAAAGVTLLAPGQAWADCLVGGVTVHCDTTVTSDTTFPANPPVDRAYQGLLGTPIVVTVDPGTTVSGSGLAFTNLGTGGVTVTNNGTISVDAGDTPASGGTAALSISAAGGPISYTGGSIINNGSGNAFDATQTAGIGSVDIHISGSASSANGHGVLVRDVAGSTGINITTGAVTALAAGKNGVYAASASLTGNLTEVANGNILAGNAGLVAVIIPVAATGNVNVTTNGSVDARFGIDAENFGTGYTNVTTFGAVNATGGIFALSTGTTSVTTVGSVTATTGVGVYALTGGGAVSVTSGSVSSTGSAAIVASHSAAAGAGAVGVTTSGSVSGTTGIIAENSGSGATTVITAGPVNGTTGNGISASSSGGNVTVTAASVASTGSAAVMATQSAVAGAGAVGVTTSGTVSGALGIIVRNFGSGSTTVTTTGPVNATTGNGVFALSTGGNVTVTTGSVSSAGNSAIVAQDVAVGANTGKIDVTLTAGSTVTANAAGAHGIWINSGQSSGTTTINVNGTIHAAGAGIGSISTTGNIVTNISATGAIDPLIGIDQLTVSGAISVNNAGLVQGDNIGVRLTSTGNGAAGALTVAQANTGSISSVVGVDLASVNATLAISNAGQITGTGAAIRMTATGTGAGTILNSGTITGGTAVLATLNNTSFMLNNVGVLNGVVNVNGSNVAASTVTNAAGASMNFGSGASSVSGNLVNTGSAIIGAGGSVLFAGNFVNAGSAIIGAGGSVLFAGNTVNSNRISFIGAGTFVTVGAMANSGIINAQNNITSNVISVGNYTGGGQFFADYSTSTVTADWLNIGGAASGNTNVTMNLVGPRTFVAGGFLPVVTVTPGAAATAFTSNTVFPTTGFVLESFGQNPNSNKQFGLIQQINPEAAILGGLSYVAEAASATLDDPISPYLSERANPAPGDKRFSLWMRGAGGHTRQTIASTFTGGGVVVNGSNEVRTQHIAMTIGADLGLLNLGGGGWNLHVGVLGGWYNGRADLSNAQQLRVETPFLGAYVAAGNGAFQFDGTLRKEWRHYEVVLPVLFGAGAPQKLNGDTTAGSVHASYRFGGKSGFGATPFIGFNYADSSIDSLPIDAISAYIPGGDKTETGEGGLRFSYRAGTDAKVVVEPFASASYLKNWSRGDSGTFSFGTPVTNFALATTTWDNAVRYSVGVTAKAKDGRVSGFLVGNVNDGLRLHSFSLNAGVRFDF